jgi:carbamoyltransferase
MRILGISAFYHDSAAALVVDGEIMAAAQEERFTRKKHDPGFPRNAIEYCLFQAGCPLREIDCVVFYEKPFLKFERLIETYLAFAPRGLQSFGMAMPIWIKEKLFQKSMLARMLCNIDPKFDCQAKLRFSEHHFSHAASAFYPSPFREAIVLTIDGVGEWATASAGVGRDSTLEIKKELLFPHSLGLLYSAFTYYTGFKVNSGEYKVMGLAPYGEPKYKNLILSKIVDLKQDGTFRLDQSYFNYCTGLTMTNEKFARLFGNPVRDPTKDPLTQFHMDVAASIQAVTDEVILRLTRSLAREYNISNLCLAGGVALNCVANGKVLRDGAFKNIWIQPAAGDAGGALGAALAGSHLGFQKPRVVNPSDSMQGALLGPAYDQPTIEQQLRSAGAVYERVSDYDAIDVAARSLANGKAVGWFQGRMEFGPRALGSRSILADPRSPTMQKLLNLKIKYRESFRPFAPAVLREDVGSWFELDYDSPYMLLVADVKREHLRAMTPDEQRLFGIHKLNVVRSTIPAVTHVDNSARIQTVQADTNPRFHALLRRFKELTGCPVLVNTSFNVRGEPIVCSPKDALRCFLGTDLDLLVCGNALLWKDQQSPDKKAEYLHEFELD